MAHTTHAVNASLLAPPWRTLAGISVVVEVYCTYLTVDITVVYPGLEQDLQQGGWVIQSLGITIDNKGYHSRLA